MGGGDVAGDRVDSSNDVGKEVTLKIRCMNGSQLVIQVNLNSTLESFKSILAQRCQIPAHQQRLIYKGRILKGDQTLESFGIEEDHTIHLVRGFATAEPAENGVRNTNPILTTNAGSNQGGPLGGSDSGSPLFPGRGLSGLDGIFGVARNSEIMREMMRYNDRAMNNIESSPEGFNMLRRMYENAQGPLLNADGSIWEGENEYDIRSDEFPPLLASLGGRPGSENSTNSHAPNTDPLPNPWASAGAGAADDLGLDRLNLSAGLGIGGGLTAANRPQGPPEELYATQLSQLQEMGFFDTSENIRALIATTGNVHAAIERLLGNPTQ